MNERNFYSIIRSVYTPISVFFLIILLDIISAIPFLGVDGNFGRKSYLDIHPVIVSIFWAITPLFGSWALLGFVIHLNRKNIELDNRDEETRKREFDYIFARKQKQGLIIGIIVSPFVILLLSWLKSR